MAEIIMSEDVFNYPVYGGDHLYDVYRDLNKKFGLNINKKDFKDTITQIGLDGHPTLTAMDNQNIPIYIFINEDFVQKNIKTMDIKIDPIVLGNDSTYINFFKELEIFADKEINKPIIYDYSTANFLRNVKCLLSQYGYGIIPVISTDYQLNGMKITYFGLGKDLPQATESFKKSPLVVKLEIPLKEGWREIYLKTG